MNLILKITFVFCLSFAILLVKAQVYAQEVPRQEIEQVIELKLPDNSNFVNVANQEEGKENNDEEISSQNQILNIPSFEQATISNYAAAHVFGLRDKLAKHGVSIIVNYMNNNFQKLYGGKNPSDKTVAQGLTSVALGIDTEKLTHRWKGGEIYVLFQNSTGASIDQDYIGDIQTINNFDTKPITLLTEYWINQKLFSDKMSIKFGKQDANLSLAVTATDNKFLNFGLNSTKTIPIPTFPTTSGGISTLIQPNDTFKFRAGWFKSDNPTKSSDINDLFVGGGHFTIAEIDVFPKYKYIQGKELYGFWQDTSQIQDLANPGTFSSNFGFYIGFHPFIYKKNKKKDDTQGLSLITHFGWAPADRNIVTRTYALGAQYQGLIPKRNNDVTGIGTTIATFSKYLQGARNETAFETFYSFQLKPWLFIQPDFQIVFHPGGLYKNAYVLALRSVITF